MGGTGTLTHGALLYRSADEFCDTVTPFLRDGLAGDQACVVATTPLNIALLRESLGDDAEAVKFIDRDEWYRHPARTVAGWRRLLEEALGRGKRYVRIVGEVRFVEKERHPTWTRYESALNDVFADAPASIICPYNLHALPAQVVADAHRTHPLVLSPEPAASPTYRAPERLLAEVREPLPPVAGDPVLIADIGPDLAALRARVRRDVTAGGWLEPARTDDLLVALTEVASNSLQHGQPPQSLRLWALPHGVVCEVHDHGSGPVDPLIAYRPPSHTVESSRGLWIAHHLCDALALDSTGGTTRVRFALYHP